MVIPRSKVLKKRNKRGNLPEIENKKLLSATPEWVEAKDLKEGDFVYMPIVKTKESNISCEDAELLGFYLAEGSSYFNKANKQYTNQFSLNMRNLYLQDAFNFLGFSCLYHSNLSFSSKVYSSYAPIGIQQTI